MESAGPRTRSKARGGDTGVPSSAAPSTRKKAAPRSARKSMPARVPPASPPKPASNVEDVRPEDIDDTASAADIPEQAGKASAPDAAAGDDSAAAAPAHQGTPAPSSSAAIAGMTPVLDQDAAASPAAFGPSPVVPIKLDSLWTPQAAQQDGTSPYAGFSPLVEPTPQAQGATPAGQSTQDGASSGSGLGQDPSEFDLASMFISTPPAAAAAAAAQAGSSSPIAGLMVAGDAPAGAAGARPSPAGAAARQQRQTPSANDSVLMGSPAPPGAFAFAELGAAAGAGGAGSPAALPAASEPHGGAPQPSAPLLPAAQPGAGATPGTPGWSVDTDLPPACSPSCMQTQQQQQRGGATPGSVCGGLRSAAKSPLGGTPGLTSGMEDDDPMPPAGPVMYSANGSPLPLGMSPLPQGDDLTEPLPPAGSPMLDTEDESEPLPPACSPMLSQAGTPAAAGAAGKTPLSSRRRSTRGGSGSTPAAAAAAAGADTDMGEAAPEAEAVQQQLFAGGDAEEGAEAEVGLLAQQLQAVPIYTEDMEREETAAAAEAAGMEAAARQDMEGGEQQQQDGGDESMQDVEAAAEEEEAGEAASGGVSFFPPAPTPASTPVAATPAAAAAAAAATSPGVTSPGVTSPGARYRSSSATTAAPPKSALAKPKSAGSSSAAPKHAHVVVPEASASPKTTPPARGAAGRTVPGSAADRFTSSQKQQGGGSPGHTPFPTKSKVRAATAAATAAAAGRAAAAPAAAAAGATSKGPSHRKEMALAAAHSALKRYGKAAAADDDAADGQGASAAAAAATPSPAPRRVSSSGVSSPSPSPATIPNVSSRLMQPTASSQAKARYSGASEGPDALMWSPPGDAAPSPAAASAGAAGVGGIGAGVSRPRLASKIVVPSPAGPSAAAAREPSVKALKRSIKAKVAEKAAATLKEGRADALEADAVRSSKLVGGSSSGGSKALKASRKAAEEELDLDTYEGEEGYEEYWEEEEGYEEEGGDVDALADSLAGLSVKPVKVAQPQGPLKGVAAPVGRHFRFDEAGNAQETPVSRQRRPATHTKFDDDGNPIAMQPAAPAGAEAER